MKLAPGKYIVVTGASGFVGRHLCTTLAKHGMAVRGLTRSSVPLSPGVETHVYTDLTQASSLTNAFHDAATVVHLAGRAHVMREQGDTLPIYRSVNVAGTIAVVEAAARAGVKRIIFASSIKAVGDVHNGLITSNTIPHPTNAYGMSKLEAEQALHHLGHELGVETCAVRLPLVYGPDVKGNVKRLMQLVRRGIPLPFKNVTNARSMIGIRNLYHIITAIIQHPEIDQATLLVSDTEDISTATLIQYIADVMGVPSRLFHLPKPMLATAARAGDMATRLGLPVPFTSAELQRLTETLVVDSTDTVRRLNLHIPWTVLDEVEFMVHGAMSA